MILDSKASSSDTKIKNSDQSIKNSVPRIIYLSVMCFVVNCLSSITLEAGSRGLFHSPMRSVIFNNLFRRNYSLRIEILMAQVLTALVSTMMLIIGDTYQIPYLYLPWLICTFEGMIFHEGPTLFEFAYATLSNASVSTGLFVSITLFLYATKLCFWKDILVNFERCWRNYKCKMLETKRSSSEISYGKSYNRLCNDHTEQLDVTSRKLKIQQDLIDSWSESATRNATIKLVNSPNEFAKHHIADSIVKSAKTDFSIKSRRSRSSFTEITS